MTANVGVSEKNYENEKGALSGNFLALKDGVNIHRVITGFRIIEQVYIPTVIENQDGSGFIRASIAMHVLKKDAGFYNTPIGKLVSMCWNINKDHEIKGSPLSVSKRNIGVVFDIEEEVTDGELPTLRLGAYPASVVEHQKNNTGLIPLQKQQTIATAGQEPKLKYGPMWAWNAIIEKVRDASQSKQWGTSYKVEVMTEDPVFAEFYNKLPLNALSNDYAKRDDLFNKVFTEAQRQAIDEGLDDKILAMNKSYKPLDTTERLLEFFEKYPIDFTAVDGKNEPIFKYPDEIYKKVTEYGIKTIEGSTVISADHQVESGVETKETTDNVEEADFKETETETETETEEVKVEVSDNDNDW